MKVAFRVDASLDIGTGHVMRCLTLADALRARGAQCLFIGRGHAGHMLEAIRQRGYEALALLGDRPDGELATTHEAQLSTPYASWLGVDWATDAKDTLTALLGQAVDWLVVDHYALDARWEQRLRSTCARIMVIDDLADRPHDCDLLLDQNLGREAEHYAALVSRGCHVLVGTDKALLRPQFAEQRSKALKRRGSQRQPERLLVAFGGVDKLNVTGHVLEILAHCALSAAARVTVVMGSHSPWLEDVRVRATKLPWPTEVKVDVADMAVLMAQSDWAIGAAGTMAWERCCMALPTVTLVLAENQRSGALALQAEGCSIHIESVSQLPNALQQLFAPNAMHKAALACARTVDGLGAQRLVSLMSELSGKSSALRTLTRNDLDRVLAWRNHPLNREVMFNQEEITTDEHYRWFEEASSDPSRRLFIFEEKGVPLGFVQFSGVKPGAVVDWGFYTAPEAPRGTGRKLGRCAIDHAFGELKVHKVCGQVLADNQASVNFHRRMGFRHEGVLREHQAVGGRYEDLVCFGLLSHEWACTRSVSSS